MAADVHLLTGPARSGKTRQLLGRWQELARDGCEAALWLVPTRRAVAPLRQRLAAAIPKGPQPILATFVEAAEAVIAANAPGWRPLTNGLRRLVLEDLLLAARERGELASFRAVVETRGFSEGVAALFAELQREAVEPPEFAHAVAQAQSAEAGGLRKGAQYAGLYTEYTHLLRRQRLLDSDGRVLHAARLLEQGQRQPFDGLGVVFVDGFATFPRSYFHFLQALSQGVPELWFTLPGENDTDRTELFSQAVATRDMWEQAQALTVHALPGEVASLLPAGLRHLERELFRPVRAIQPTADADGICLIEAPGLLGEARMVARRIKALLLAGVAADDILVTMRDLQPYADLLREVFGEYGIPLDMEGVDPLNRSPAVTVLLRALRLPEEDWPFAGVTALLRSGYFQPDWPETQTGPEIAQRAEVLLRLLGEPRGKDTYLAAVRRWAERPEPGLEDEQAEESRRRKIHELAVQCRPFLERFFQAWDEAPAQAPVGEHLAWLRRFAQDLGLRAAGNDPAEAMAWARLWEELEHWRRLDTHLHRGRTRSRKDFLRSLWTLTAEVGTARTPRGPGRVRVLAADLAQHLSVNYLFLLGLGERSFPQLTSPDLVLDEAERQTLRRAGLGLRCAADALPEEMLLFYRIVTCAGRQLVHSYPAVDEKGQALLPSSFLAALLECFEPGTIPVERRSMLIERYNREPPLCPAEYRVRAALSLNEGGRAPLAADLAANLTAAQRMHHLRLLTQEFSPYEGSFRDPAVLAELQQLYGPQKIFSPTALEDYVACPFRFFLGSVLRLAPLEEPREEIEVTRRGQAFHRALARLHTQLKQDGIDDPGDGVEASLRTRLDEAVAEYAARASSPASKELWKIEGDRLKRHAERYGKHWREFRKPWLALEVVPRPYDFEVDFGLPAAEGKEPWGPLIIRRQEVEVRISGRIDRIDMAELEGEVGFWIIDYKTGRSDHYTGPELAQFRRLQLTLYALAVEQVLLVDRTARPLGLAYWMVGEKGAKVALPVRKETVWFNEPERWRQVREQLQHWVVTLVTNIRHGVFPLKPRSEHCTQTCDFGQVCRITQSRSIVKTWELPLPEEQAGKG